MPDFTAVSTLPMWLAKEKEPCAFVCVGSPSADESPRFQRIMPLAEAVL